MNCVTRGNIGTLTPQRAALIWMSESTDSGEEIHIIVPFGTARFRILQAILFGLFDDSSVANRIGRIRPRQVVLRSTSALAWELMNGYQTLEHIAHQIADRAGGDEMCILDALYNFCREAHAMGIVNIDFPSAPLEGYASGLLEDIEKEPLASAFSDSWLRSKVIKAVTSYDEAIWGRVR